MEYKTIAIKIYYLLYENIVLKCNQISKSASYVKETAR